MITSSEEYYQYLSLINDMNPPSVAIAIPKSERIYNINLNTREIESPSFISVVEDHQAEIIFFKADRFFDGVDLSQTSILVNYINAKGNEGIYIVPFTDISEGDKILIPWLIEAGVTAGAGNVQFSFQFFKTEGNLLSYNLNTLIGNTTVLNSLKKSTITMEQFYANQLEQLINRIDNTEKDQDLYWIDA